MRFKEVLKRVPYIRDIYIFIFRFFSSYDKYNYGPFKYFGMHLIRLLLAFGRVALGRLMIQSKSNDITFSAFVELRLRGIAVLSNFLNDLEISHLRKLIQVIEAGTPPEGVQIFKQDGASYIFANVTEMIDSEKLVNIQKLCQNYLGHSQVVDLQFWLHGVEDDETSAEGAKKDINLLWHTDTFHPTVKGFLYLDPLKVEEGPFEYFSGSHLLSFQRLLFEYISSLKNGATQGFRVPEPTAVYPSDSAKLFAGLGNALIVADTFGFHRRGSRSTKGKRYSLHFSSRTNPYRFFARVQD